MNSELHDKINTDELLYKRSGEVRSSNKLTSFLYDLMRDHLPTSTVEKLVRDAQYTEVKFTNGWLASYANDLASRLEQR
jgi:hypothetical protein